LHDYVYYLIILILH